MRKGQSERMSKLQKIILKKLYAHETKNSLHKDYFELMGEVGYEVGSAKLKEAILGIKLFRVSASFKVVFANSIRNLAKKGYVNLIYTCEKKETGVRYHTCNRKPKEYSDGEIEICKDCPILSKGYRIWRAFRDHKEGRCYFMITIRDRKGIPHKGSHIEEVALTEKGREYVLKINFQN